MDININLNVNSQPLVEMAGNLNEANSNANNLNDTLSNKTPENQITKNSLSIGKAGRAMTGLRAAVTGFDKLTGSTMGAATQNAGALGQAFLGIGKILPLVTGGFRALGATLLANPIFAIVAVIVAVVAGFVLLLSKLGLLQPILDAIGAAFQALIDGLKAVTNWLGLTSNAVEDAKKQTEGYNSSLDLLNKTLDRTIRNKDRDIAIAKAQGKSISEIKRLEDERTESLKTNLDTQRKATQEILMARRKELNGLSNTSSRYKDLEKEIEELTATRTEIENKLYDAETDRQVRQIEYNKEINKGKKENNKTNDEDLKKAKKRTAELVKLLNEETKKITENNNKQLDILKQNLIDGLITEETFAAEKVLLDKKTNDESIQLRNDFNVSKEDLAIIGAENEKFILQNNAEEVLKLQRANADIELGIIKSNNASKVKQTAEDEKDRIETFEREWLQKKIDLLAVEGLKEEELVAKLKQLEIDKNKAKLESLQVGSSEYLALKEQIATQERDIDKKTTDEAIKNAEDLAKKEKELRDASFELANAGLTSLTTISDIYFQSKLKAAKGNAVEEEKIARQQFKVNKAFQIGQAVMNGLQSVLAITSTAVDPTGITTALRVAAQIALNVGTIAKIASTQFSGGGASNAGGQGGSTTAISVPTTPSFNLFGQGNNMNVSSAQPTTSISDPQGNILSVIAQVSETEISAVQARNRRYSNSAEL
jgi:hypothetical protein